MRLRSKFLAEKEITIKISVKTLIAQQNPTIVRILKLASNFEVCWERRPPNLGTYKRYQVISSEKQ